MSTSDVTTSEFNMSSKGEQESELWMQTCPSYTDVGLSVHLSVGSPLQSRIKFHFIRDIHGPQRMNLTDSVDPLTFPPPPPSDSG